MKPIIRLSPLTKPGSTVYPRAIHNSDRNKRSRTSCPCVLDKYSATDAPDSVKNLKIEYIFDVLNRTMDSQELSTIDKADYLRLVRFSKSYFKKFEPTQSEYEGHPEKRRAV